MNRFFLLVTALLLLAACSQATPAPAEPTGTTAAAAPAPVPAAAEGFRTFAVVSEESTASYLVNEEFFADALRKYNIAVGKGVTIGSTQTVQGFLQLDLAGEQPLGENRFVVDLTGLTSDQSLRDGWLRDNALESNQFPEAVFVASSIAGAPENYTEGDEATFQLVGELTVRSISLPVTFDVTATLSRDTIRGVAEANVKMSDFGVTPPNFANTLVVTDLFTIRMELTAKEQK
ncbi:MAG: YceI family protein [Caldilineaceae bacterium]|nr:YceI family protein [Caldilineaceae bacterium]